MNKYILIMIMGLFSVLFGYSQNRIIQGKVVDDIDLQPVLFLMIFIDDSIKVGEADTCGFFRIEVPKNVDKIIFKSIDTEVTELTISNDCNYVELIMVADFKYDYRSIRKINRRRKKRYDNLPKLHKEAFEKGIFKYPDICYTQKFIPFGSVK